MYLESYKALESVMVSAMVILDEDEVVVAERERETGGTPLIQD